MEGWRERGADRMALARKGLPQDRRRLRASLCAGVAALVQGFSRTLPAASAVSTRQIFMMMMRVD